MEKLLLVIPLFSYTVVMPQIQSDRLWIDWRDSIFKSLKRNAREEIMDIYQSNRLQVYASIPPSSRDLDGLTEVFLEGDIKTFKVFINPRVINSQFRCFRFAVILHEIMHVRTYNDESLHTKDQLDSEPKHGRKWMEKVRNGVNGDDMIRQVALTQSRAQRCLFENSGCDFCSHTPNFYVWKFAAYKEGKMVDLLRQTKTQS